MTSPAEEDPRDTAPEDKLANDSTADVFTESTDDVPHDGPPIP